MLGFILYGPELVDHTHNEGHKLNIFENRMLEKYFDLTGRK